MSLAQTCHSFTVGAVFAFPVAGADLRGPTPGLGLLFGLLLARLPENVVVTACSGVVGLGVPRLLGGTGRGGGGLGLAAGTVGAAPTGLGRGLGATLGL